MKDMHLNVGGIIGGFVGLGAALAIVFMLRPKEEVGKGFGKLCIFGIIGGAVAGNFLWGLAFRKRENHDEDTLRFDE